MMLKLVLKYLFILQLACRALGTTVDDFSQPGPYSFETFDLIVVTTPENAQGLPTNEYKATVRIPDSTPNLSPAAVIIWFNGFMSEISDYTTILDQAASWGFASAAYTLPPTAVNLSLKSELDYIIPAFMSSVVNNATLFPQQLPLFSVGYSRGGKVAASIYANPPQNTSIQACYLIDPVDITTFSPDSPSNPSAVAALAAAALQSNGTSLPLGITAAGITGSCNPLIGNYQKFWDVAGASSWLGILPDVAYTAFVDSNSSGSVVGNVIADVFCGGGSSKDTSQVAQLTYVPMLNWLTRSTLLLESGNGSSVAALKAQEEEFARWVAKQEDLGNLIFEIKKENPSIPPPAATVEQSLPPSPPLPVTPRSSAQHFSYSYHSHPFVVLLLLLLAVFV